MITIITGCTPNMLGVAAISRPTIERYCEKWGFEFMVCDLIEFSRPASWQKISLLLNEIDFPKLDEFLLWVDTDAIILNQDFDVRSLIKDGKHIYISKDPNGINLGVCMWMCCPYSGNILNKMWHMEHCINHPWWEQQALAELIGMNFQGIQDHIEYVPQNVFNAYDYSLYLDKFPNGHPEGQFDKNSFIVHFPGMSNEARISQMKKLL
jgi:galactosyl transferase GMA12/MNN10 family